MMQGHRFGRLLAIKKIGDKSDKKSYWICVCDCGTKKKIWGENIFYGRTKSCGCFQAEQRRKSETHFSTHRMTGTAEYRTWLGIRKRCYSKTDAAYPNYGGKGIKMSREWRDSFQAFFNDMGRRPSNSTSIDRINNKGNYEKGNCRWADWKTQNRNTSFNRFIEFRGKRKCVAEWAEITGLTHNAILLRIKKGWTVERALTEPLRPY